MRGSSAWTYPLVNLAHILGVATLFGSVLLTDLALLGVWRRKALPALAHAASPVSAAGFVLAAVTGVGLLASNATEYRGNLFFLVKFPAIAAGVVNALVLRRTTAWQALDSRELTPRESSRLAWMGGLSLVCWLTAVTAGRLIGYW